MPEGLIEGLITFLGILFFFVIPLIARARSAAQRGRQLGGLRPPPFGLPRAPEVAEEEPPSPRPPPFQLRRGPP
jgi:hypothetical protein